MRNETEAQSLLLNRIPNAAAQRKTTKNWSGTYAEPEKRRGSFTEERRRRISSLKSKQKALDQKNAKFVPESSVRHRK